MSRRPLHIVHFLPTAVGLGLTSLSAEKSPSARSSCPSGYDTYTASGETFCRAQSGSSWQSSKASCEANGMQLVEITTQAKADIVDSWCMYDCGWIGLACGAASNSPCDSDFSAWNWAVDGSAVTSTLNKMIMGSDGTIYGGGSNEFCTHWWQNGDWAPGPCSAGYKGICEFPSAPDPTPSPTTAASVNAAATGDPHLQNVNGDRFDVMKPGNHVLVSIPRGKRAENAMLRVEAEASKLGGLCEDIYFTDLNVTGSWAYAKRAGGYHFATQSPVPETSGWIALGAIEFKVVHAHTTTGTQYLNFYIKHLGRAGFAVGGLLGEDDHVVESTPSAACVQHMQLSKLTSPPYSRNSAVSIAGGTFA